MTKRKDEPESAPAPATYRALVGFNYPNPAGPQQKLDGEGKPMVGKDGEAILEPELRVEAGDSGLVLPDAIAAAQLAQGAIAKE